MRCGILSDIHANRFALDACLAAVRREGVDILLCLGDLVGYGPHPNECVERIAELAIPCVAGNHDRIALGLLPDDRCIRLARESLRWTRRLLTDDVRRYLEALPTSRTAPGGLLLAHGSLDDPREYVTRPEQAEAQLREAVRREPELQVLLLGHTHRAWAYDPDRGTVRPSPEGRVALTGPVLLNPGSVGQSRDRAALARFLVLDLDRREATFHAIPYDVRACREALRSLGLPAHSCHLPPSPLRSLRGLAGRVRRMARGMGVGC